ncbi:MAG: hypothetical protein IPI72_13385 [Flavobacteriales bacterium]|nr:hypothetical protein [Flavobacteriales bacterium]
MRAKVFLTLLSLTTAGSSQEGPSPLPNCPVEAEHYMIFNDTEHNVNFFGDRMSLAPMSAMEVAEVECLLLAFHDQCMRGTTAFRDSLQHASKGRVTQNFVMVRLNEAHRQYQAGHDRKGKLLVYVNGLCRPTDDRWKQDWVFFHDGGPCYWHAVVNLTDRRIERLVVNGFG